MLDIKRGFQRLLEILDRLEIPYMVGGSLASSVHGIYRSTNDIDIVVRMNETHVQRLVSELGTEFYADADTMRDALQRQRPFNFIHYATSCKFDLFPMTDDPYHQAQFERSRMQEVPLGSDEAIRCRIVSAEDAILAKLAWYRAGGEQSEHQWNDLRGVHTVQRGRLDQNYMHRWAQHLSVEDLLKRLQQETS
jgi:hypothetical protein